MDSLFQVLVQSKDAEKGKIYAKLAWEYRFTNPDSAIVLAEKGLELQNNLSDKAALYKALGIAYTIKTEYPKAIELFKQNLKISKETNDLKGQAHSETNIGVVYYYQGDYATTQTYYFKALATLEKLGDARGIATCLQNIGSVYAKISKFNKALEYYKRALQKHDEYQGTPDDRASIIQNMAMIYGTKNKLDSALMYYKQAENIFISTKNYRNLGGTNTNQGTLYVQMKKYDEAMTCFRSALKYQEKIGNEKGKLNTLSAISKRYLETKNLDSALYYSKKAYTKAKALNTQRKRFEINKRLVKIHEQSGNYQQALRCQKENEVLRDSLYGLDMEKHLSELETKYDTQKKEQEIELLNKDVQIKKQENRAQTLYITLLIITLLALSVFVFFLLNRISYRRKLLSQRQQLYKKEKNEQALLVKQSQLEQEKEIAERKIKEAENLKLKQEIEHKNRELLSMTMNMSDKNKVLNEVLRHLKENPEISIKKIQSVIKNTLNLDADWQKLQLHFNQVHPHFFDTLRELYPTITSLELKHCAYLKIDLSIKDIARLLNISHKSVQMAHYRLKKKMQLPEDVTLSSYLHGLKE
ncbi:tetratricopeptide repeat protein [Fulvivirga sp. M361]|uniref:tetratricopeptide repeat protein n=1 Tax=Fulvivirga sp. M361 TaxID=2594266 RepID=UPI00162719D8|nr:tetratricopeptide repeat protein [Fulvivirga sp. M361]